MTFRLPEGLDPGIYELNILRGEQIMSISFCTKVRPSFSVLTTTGKLFTIALVDGGLHATCVDISDIQDQRGN